VLALAELLGLVALMIASGALLCWGIDELIAPAGSRPGGRPSPSAPPYRKRKRVTCPARIVNGRKR